LSPTIDKASAQSIELTPNYILRYLEIFLKYCVGILGKTEINGLQKSAVSY